ncbi:Putative ferredoxin reductase protein (fragment) [Mesorhizobium prunaredense]|uniref:Putative ferredoxin reductase protein n=1 Tax=Mesorhizobium prunaredense TaxID=1631249 RepID=A0A1R3V9X9_9HYPH
MLLIAIGVTPETALAEASGLEVDNGVVVDEYLRTTDPSIFAAGDASCIRRAGMERPLRLECWKNAEDQGDIVAKNMLGIKTAYQTVPWMWSDQFDKVVQAAGLPSPDQTIALRPLGMGALVAFHYDAPGMLAAVSGYGPIGLVAKAVRIGSVMLQRGISPTPEAVRAASDLRELIQARQEHARSSDFSIAVGYGASQRPTS